MDEFDLIRSFRRNDATPDPVALAAARARLTAHIAADVAAAEFATHAEFRTAVAVSGVTVTGVLPGTEQLPMGSIAIGGDVQRLSCDQALELVDALMMVVMRMDHVAEERYGTTTSATDDRQLSDASQPMTQRPAAERA